MNRMIVDIRKFDEIRPAKFEVPGNQPISEFLEHLVTGMGWEKEIKGDKLYYWLAKDMKSIQDDDISEYESIALDSSKSLSENSISNGMNLVVCWSTSKPSKSAPIIKPYPRD